MAKRIYWETVKKWAIKAGIPVGIASFALLFVYLSSLGVIEVTGYSGDMVCAGTTEDPCLAYINFTVKEDIFIYPMDYDPWGRDTPFETDKGLKSWKMYRSWGTGWREIKLNETCTGTWCGAPDNRGVSYSFVFREGRDYQIKIVAYKEDPNEDIKWGFGPVDPVWYGLNIGYEFLDDGKVVHIWNTQDDYFFNKSSGIQLTNHYQDYWTRNIFCIGYYSGETWNKISCADELENFNRDIQTDNLTYVNATLWKDIDYGSYDLRVGVNYYLGVDDKSLSITIYGKNTGIDIPFDLGFAWKVKDVEIATTEEDYISLNDTEYKLDGTFDLLFKNMTTSNFDEETNETIIQAIPTLRVHDRLDFLRIDWNENLNYAVKMYGDGNQENFYVALLVNAGHFNPQQEKSTTFQWIDAPFDPVPIGTYTTTGGLNSLESAGDVFVLGDYAYTLSTIDDSLAVWNISAHGNPIPLGGVSDSTGDYSLDNAQSVYVSGDYAYTVSRNDNVFAVWNISAHGNPAPAGTYYNASLGVTMSHVHVSGNYAYVVYYSTENIAVFDISGHGTPVLVGNYINETSLAGVSSVFVLGDYAYTVGYLSGTLTVFDISAHGDPVFLGSVTDKIGANSLDGAIDVIVVGDYAYTSSSTDHVLAVWNISAHGNPVPVGSVTDTAGDYSIEDIRGIDVVGDYAYTTSYDDDTFAVWDISGHGNPVPVGTYTDSEGAYSVDGIVKVFASEGYAYTVSNIDDTLAVFNVSEQFDTIAPTYSDAQTNTTVVGESVLFSILYNDNWDLDPKGQYIFSTNNTGNWVNESVVNFTATPSWANVTDTLNSTSGTVVGYRWYADDNLGNINNTGIYTLTTGCGQNSDCEAGEYCDTDQICQSDLADGVTCDGVTYAGTQAEEDGACANGYCDSDGVGAADDNHCFTPYDTHFDGEENTKCEYSTDEIVTVLSDEYAVLTDLNDCNEVGEVYFEDEVSATCELQDVTSVFECTDSGCSCGDDECDGVAPGAAINYCDKGGDTFFQDDCGTDSTAVDYDDTCVAAGSLQGGDGCTADSECDGETAGTGDCDEACAFVGDLLLDILDPTTGNPESVSSGDNITVSFNFSVGGTNRTTGVTFGNITIGGVEATIIGEAGGEGVSFFDAFNDGTNWTETGDCGAYWQYASSTGSGGTGPQDGDSDDAGTNFVFMETSSGYCDGSPSSGYLVYVNEIDWDAGINDNITFETNRHGNGDLGTMILQENSTGSWLNTTYNQTGPDGNSGLVWTAFSVDASELTGIGYLRFWSFNHLSYTGDAAIDKFNVTSEAAAGQEFGYYDGSWKANVTVPTFESGLKDLFVNASYGSGSANDTETNAIDYGAVDTCTCPGAGNNWEVNMSHYCNMTEACTLTTGNLSWIGTYGYFNCSENLNLSNRDAPPSGTIFYHSSGCEIIYLIALIFVSATIFKKRRVFNLTCQK